MDLSPIRKAVKEISDRIVSVKTGTVVSNNVAPENTRVVLDGDSSKQPVAALGLNGRYASGKRVSCLAYPGGLVVLGVLGDDAEDWIDVATGPGFSSTWTNFVAPWQPAEFRRVGGDMVEMRGLVTGGVVGQPVFILPEGYRPTKYQMVNGIAQTQAAAAGTITGGQASNASNTTTSTQSPAGATANHTHTLGHTHNTLTGTTSVSVTHVGSRLDVYDDGQVVPVSLASTGYFWIGGYFYLR